MVSEDFYNRRKIMGFWDTLGQIASGDWMTPNVPGTNQKATDQQVGFMGRQGLQVPGMSGRGGNLVSSFGTTLPMLSYFLSALGKGVAPKGTVGETLGQAGMDMSKNLLASMLSDRPKMPTSEVPQTALSKALASPTKVSTNLSDDLMKMMNIPGISMRGF